MAKYEKRPLELHIKQWEADDVLDTLMDTAWTTIDDVMTTQYTKWTDDMLEKMAGRCRALANYATGLGLAKGRLLHDTPPAVHGPDDPPSVDLVKAGDVLTGYLCDPKHQMTLARHSLEAQDVEFARFLRRLLACCWSGGDGSGTPDLWKDDDQGQQPTGQKG